MNKFSPEFHGDVEIRRVGCEYAPTNAVTSLDHPDAKAGAGKIGCRGKSGNACSHDQNIWIVGIHLELG